MFEQTSTFFTIAKFYVVGNLIKNGAAIIPRGLLFWPWANYFEGDWPNPPYEFVLLAYSKPHLLGC